jgi:hypothetical protein
VSVRKIELRVEKFLFFLCVVLWLVMWSVRVWDVRVINALVEGVRWIRRCDGAWRPVTVFILFIVRVGVLTLAPTVSTAVIVQLLLRVLRDGEKAHGARESGNSGIRGNIIFILNKTGVLCLVNMALVSQVLFNLAHYLVIKRLGVSVERRWEREGKGHLLCERSGLWCGAISIFWLDRHFNFFICRGHMKKLMRHIVPELTFAPSHTHTSNSSL